MTGLTEALTGRLARGIRNRLMDALVDLNSTSLPFPLQHALTQTIASPAAAQERPELMTLWAGQSASLSHCTEAAELMKQLVTEGDACCGRLLGSR